MTHSRFLLYALAAAGGLTACSDRFDQAPTAPAGADLEVAAAAPSAGCDLSVLKQDANRYFSVTADRQKASTIIGALSKATGAARTSLGFDLLALTAEVTNLRAHGTPAQGSALANSDLACMPTLAPAPSLPIDFVPALSAGGVFEVRGGSADNSSGAVVARGVSTDVAWGAEPPLRAAPLTGRQSWGEIGRQVVVASGTQQSSVTQRFLIYGSARTTFTSADDFLDAAYDWSTVPATLALAATNGTGLRFQPGLLIAYCGVSPGRAYVQHEEGAAGQLLPFANPSFCTGTVGARPGDASLFTRLASAVADLVRPAPLQAAMYFAAGVGGTKGSLSPFGVVDLEGVTLGFTPDPPGDATTTTPIPEFRVRALSAAGTPIPGTPVTITVAGNSGSFRILLVTGTTTTAVGSVTEITGADGYALFSGPGRRVILDKPGGYTLTAVISGYTPLSALPVPSKVSLMFHITQ